MADIQISFDIETLHTRADGVILSIAAAARVNGSLEVFYSHCGLESQHNRAFSQDTLNWWYKQPELWAKTRELCQEAEPLANVLRDLSRWYSGLGEDKDRLYPWGNGANFDLAFLEHAFDEQGVKCPWAYWTGRDLRTLEQIAKDLDVFESVERVGTHHDARDDAITQLLRIEKCLEAIHGCRTPATV
ncbi:3'-5' exonuclease [Vreelandella massiliensis]|uniref:3'-5' exonuclease n=1 Tax=Vreelandella massiliensis TaxID=1816686 RepID=UPI00096ACAE3|nr:3'-5' exonuclease [Halomonas massiliensis]